MRRPAVWLVITGVLLELLFCRLAALGDLRQHASVFLVDSGLAFLVYLWAVAVVRQCATTIPAPVVAGVLLAAVAFRVTLAGLTPTLSDDIYRYLWDGRVQLAGLNPYRYAPDDAALRPLRDDAWALMNHKAIPTIYPPLMQLAFRLGAWIRPTLLMQKLVFLACDLALMAVLAVALPWFGIPPIMSLVYAWHPLAVVEVAASGHNDPLGVLLMVLGLGLWQLRRKVLATAGFALACLSKFTTVLLWPFYLVRERRLLAWFLVGLAVSAPWMWCSPHLRPGLGYYTGGWEFNSSLYRLGIWMLGNPLVVRGLSAAGVLALGGWLAWRSDDIAGYLLAMIQATVLVTPVLEPWYLLWLIPLLCIRFSWVWLVFSGLSLLSYTVLVSYVHHGAWRIPAWATALEYAPLYGWLIWRMVRWRRCA